MTRMTLDSEIIRKLAHSGLKTLSSLTDLFQLYDMDATHGLHDPATRKSFHRSLHSLSQAIRDLRLIAICADMADEPRHPMDWKSVINDHSSGRYKGAVEVSSDEVDYRGDGYGELIGFAVENIAWFAKKFWKSPVRARLGIVEKDGRPWVRCVWEFGGAIAVGPEFESFSPFHPMFPKESLALDQSTGLALCACREVAKLHGGDLVAHAKEGSLIIEWDCPKSGGKPPRLEALV